MEYQYYSIHHLVVASSIPLPELAQTAPQPADVHITEGEVPVRLNPEKIGRKGTLWNDRFVYEIEDDRVLFTFTTTGRMMLYADNSIVIDKYDHVDYAKVRQYLLGTCFGMLLIRQGIFPFHGSTICTPLGTVMFVGASGWGKSTTAAKFLKEGHTLLTDDVCVVRLHYSIPYAYPSGHRLKLWDDSLTALGYGAHESQPVMPDWNKKQLMVGRQLASSPQPLTIIYQLWPEDDNILALQLLRSDEKLVALASHTYRMEGVGMFDRQRDHFAFCSAIAQSIPVVRLRRPIDEFAIDDLYQLVMTDLTNKQHQQSANTIM